MISLPCRYDAAHHGTSAAAVAAPAQAASTPKPKAGALFGVTLDKVTLIDKASGLPLIIPKCIEYIKAEGVCACGLGGVMAWVTQA